MLLRRILNGLVVVSIVVAISAIFISLYNKSKLESDGFRTNSNTEITETTKKEEKKLTKTEENKTKKTDKVESDDNETNEEETEEIDSNEVPVESTSSEKSIYYITIGSMTLLLGMGLLTFKINN